MAFFDKKEEVLDLVLTRRGRELLAEGKLNPAYYDFFDDEVIYDYKYASTGSAEAQNSIVPRIKESVALKSQSGWQEAVNVATNRKKIPLLFKPLAKSSQFEEHKPAWELNVVEGQVNGEVTSTPIEYSNGKLQNYMEDHIPQVEVVCDYSSSQVNNKLIDPDLIQMWVSKTSDDLLINLEEHNVDDTEDNFTLEVFKYVYADIDGSEKIVDIEPMKFSEDEHDQGIVEYFFNILTDADVDDELTIKYIDEDIEKQFETDKCAGDKSCAEEKIERLKKEIEKLKSDSFKRDLASGAYDIELSIPEQKCREAYKCIKCTYSQGTAYWQAVDEAEANFWIETCNEIEPGGGTLEVISSNSKGTKTRLAPTMSSPPVVSSGLPKCKPYAQGDKQKWKSKCASGVCEGTQWYTYLNSPSNTQYSREYSTKDGKITKDEWKTHDLSSQSPFPSSAPPCQLPEAYVKDND